MVPGTLAALRGMATPRRYIDRDYLRHSVGAIYGGIFRTRPELVTDLLRHVRWQSRRGYYLQLLAAAGWTSVHWLHRLPQPTLVMSGDDDPITRPINAKLQFALLRDAQFWRIDCGHLFLLTRADESAAAIRAFLENP
jgi:pimeloyl-ACP methyl ester carboxylesterase